MTGLTRAWDCSAVDWCGELQEARKPERSDGGPFGGPGWTEVGGVGHEAEQTKGVSLGAVQTLSPSAKWKELERSDSQRHLGQALGTLIGKI